MSGFLGADTEALRSHADRVAEGARRLLELRDSLEPLVMDEAMWRGPDADAFRESWTGRASTMFQLRSEALTSDGESLRRHAEEQDTVSEDGGAGASVGGGAGGGAGGGVAGGGGQGDPFSPLGFLKDLAMKGQGLYGKAKTLADFASRIGPAAGEYRALAERGLEGLWKQTYLDELFKSGKSWQSAAEKALGKLGLPTSLGNIEPLKVLNKLDDVAPWLRTAGRGIGRVLPAVDIAFGIDKIANSDNWYDRTSGILSTAGGALMIAAPFTGPAAPIVGAVGAGLGLVSAGMDLGKLVHDNWGGITSTVSHAAESVASGVGHAAQSVSEGIGNAASSVADSVGDAASTVSDGIGRVGKAFGF